MRSLLNSMLGDNINQHMRIYAHNNQPEGKTRIVYLQIGSFAALT